MTPLTENEVYSVVHPISSQMELKQEMNTKKNAFRGNFAVDLATATLIIFNFLLASYRN